MVYVVADCGRDRRLCDHFLWRFSGNQYIEKNKGGKDKGVSHLQSANDEKQRL